MRFGILATLFAVGCLLAASDASAQCQRGGGGQRGGGQRGAPVAMGAPVMQGQPTRQQIQMARRMQQIAAQQQMIARIQHQREWQERRQKVAARAQEQRQRTAEKRRQSRERLASAVAVVEDDADTAVYKAAHYRNLALKANRDGDDAAANAYRRLAEKYSGQSTRRSLAAR